MDISTEVILCTYNGAAFINEQLGSILSQTQKVTKISIYDDQSSDDTLQKIELFISNLPLQQQGLFNLSVNLINLGYAENFCSAIAKATEEILFLCDQDDIWQPEKVALLTGLLSDHKADMAFSDGTMIDSHGKKIGDNSVLGSYGLNKKQISCFCDNAFELLMKRNYINGAAIAIRRSAAQSALPLPCNMPHDYWLGIWCSLHNGVIATPQLLYNYRQHGGNVIGIASSNPLRILLNLWKYCDEPRARETQIWQAVTKRISSFSDKQHLDISSRKLAWISSVASKEKVSWHRSYNIITSILNGNYQRFSPEYSLLRDIFSVFKGIIHRSNH